MDNKQNETATETADGKSLNHSVTDRKLGFVSFFDSQVTKVEVLSDMDAVEPVNGSSRVHNIKIEIEADQQRISSSAPLIAVEDGNLVPELSPIAQINSGVGGQFVIERHDGKSFSSYIASLCVQRVDCLIGLSYWSINQSINQSRDWVKLNEIILQFLKNLLFLLDCFPIKCEASYL